MRIVQLFVIVCTYSAASSEVLAQTTLIGRTGVNYPSSFSASPFLGIYPSIYAVTSQPSITMSGLVEKKLSDDFSIKFGLEYAQIDVSVGSYADFIKSVSLKYIEAPLLAQINFDIPTTPFQVFAFAGPKVRCNVSSIYTFTRGTSPTNLITQTTDIKRDVRPFDIALEGGVGIGYNFSPQMQIFLDGRYIFGLLDITTRPDIFDPSYTRDMRLGVGIKIVVND